MIIDEDKQYALARYLKRKGINHKVYSDHNPLIMDLKIRLSKTRSKRVECFNFRNIECQETFFNITNCADQLENWFTNEFPLKKTV